MTQAPPIGTLALMTAPTRKTKSEADYSRSTELKEFCGICEHFHDPNRCEIVVGAVKWNGWCKFFSRDPRAFKSESKS